MRFDILPLTYQMMLGRDAELNKRLQTTLTRIPLLANQANANLIREYYDFMRNEGTSEHHQNNHLKTIMSFSSWLWEKFPNMTFFQFDNKSKPIILQFLQTKQRDSDEDPEEKWRRTYNDYSDRIKHFFRWLHNVRVKESPADQLPKQSWETPQFAQLQHMKLKRLTPYSRAQKWSLEEFTLATSKEDDLKRRAAFRLLWDTDGRPHELTNIKRKNISFKDKYAQGEIPHGKTGARAFLLTTSFWDVFNWYNQHPFKDPNVFLICDSTGQKIDPDTITKWLYDLKEKIKLMLINGAIKDEKEAAALHQFLEQKRWNAYCFRHSAITHDANFYTEFNVRAKAGWVPNSKQPGRYITPGVGPQLQDQILKNAGIIEDSKSIRPSIIQCGRCNANNPPDGSLCMKCQYPLNVHGFEEIKLKEDEWRQKMEAQIKALTARIAEDNTNDIALLTHAGHSIKETSLILGISEDKVKERLSFLKRWNSDQKKIFQMPD